jgi:hypothetical protein
MTLAPPTIESWDEMPAAMLPAFLFADGYAAAVFS